LSDWPDNLAIQIQRACDLLASQFSAFRIAVIVAPMFENSAILREWEVLDNYYQYDEFTPAARRIGERMLEHGLFLPVGHSRELTILSDGALHSQWNYENPPRRPHSSIRCEEIPSEEVTEQMIASALRPTCIEEE
jgi:hypothetical protein